MAQKSPTVALILIGSELLSGRTPDANMNYFANKMAEVGISFKECRVIPDDHTVIVDTINELRSKFTYVFTTGGIGPTHDDITVACLSDAFGVPVVRHQPTVRAFEEYYGDKLKPATLKMADMPEGSELIPNPLSIAPGFYIGNVYVLAGVPQIMRTMLDHIVPTLQHGDVVASRSVDVWAGESIISDDLEAVQNLFGSDVEVGSYPYSKDGRHGTHLVVRSAQDDQLNASFEAILNFLDKLGVEYTV